MVKRRGESRAGTRALLHHISPHVFKEHGLGAGKKYHKKKEKGEWERCGSPLNPLRSRIITPRELCVDNKLIPLDECDGPRYPSGHTDKARRRRPKRVPIPIQFQGREEYLIL